MQLMQEEKGSEIMLKTLIDKSLPLPTKIF
jgi:hypothetical protein